MNTKLLLAPTLLVSAVVFSIQAVTVEAAGGGGSGMKGKMGKRGTGWDTEEQLQDRTAPAEKPNPEIVEAFFPQRATREGMEKRGFLATGLEAIYPDNYECPKAESPFASPLRSDGSQRSPRFFQGLHGGMDIPQPDGTPLLALADGEIIVKHEGETDGIGGLGIWVRHRPEDTGTGKFVFIEYKHLAKLPDLAIGERVTMGQAIAVTGNTGTADGYYGSAGFYHLHMTAYWSDTPDFKFTRVLIPEDGHWLDPLALMQGGPLDSRTARDLPPDQKKVRIPFKTSDGHIFPEDTRIVWPFACRPR